MPDKPPKPIPPGPGTAAVLRLDYATYLTKVAEVASNLSSRRLDRGRRARAGDVAPDDPQAPRRLTPRARRKVERRLAPKGRRLSAAAKASFELQLQMLASLPAHARGPFVKELAEHCRRFPALDHYLGQWAAAGSAEAAVVLAWMDASAKSKPH